jgi:hypothetical protein
VLWPTTFQGTNYSRTQNGWPLTWMPTPCSLPSAVIANNPYFVDAQNGNLPNLSYAAGMGSNDTLTVAAPPAGFAYWPAGQNYIGPAAYRTTPPPANLTVNFNAGAIFGYPYPDSQGFLIVSNNGTTINGGSAFWVNSSDNQACIAWVAGLDLTVNGFYCEGSDMGIDRGSVRQGITNLTNDTFENIGTTKVRTVGSTHNIYLLSSPMGGFDTLFADNITLANSMTQGWRLKLRIPNTVVTNSFMGSRANNGADDTHGPIDYPCAGTHSVTYSVMETNQFSFNNVLSHQPSSFLTFVNEEASTSVATSVGGAAGTVAGDPYNCPTGFPLPTYAGISATTVDANTFTTATNPALFAPFFNTNRNKQTGYGFVWDLGTTAGMLNGPAQIVTWDPPSGGLYTVRVSCTWAEGTLPLSKGINIYSCFSASAGTAVTLYPMGQPTTVLSNTTSPGGCSAGAPCTASVSVPVNPAEFGIAVGDTLWDTGTPYGLTVTSITGTGPYTVNLSCRSGAGFSAPFCLASGDGGTNLNGNAYFNASIVSGTYNSSNGAVVLTLGADAGMAVGNVISTGTLNGTGNVAALSGLSYTLTAVNSGCGSGVNTICFTAASGLGATTIGSTPGGVGAPGGEGLLPSTLDGLFHNGPVQVTASTTGSGCDGTNTLCGIATNPIGMQVLQGWQVIGTGVANTCMVAAQMGFIYPKGGRTGTGYSVGQTVTLAGGTFEQAAVYTIDSVSGGAITGGHISTGGVYSSFVTSQADYRTFTQGSTSGSGTGAQFQFPYPKVIVGGPGPYTLRLAQTSGANCVTSTVSNQAYTTAVPTKITWDHDLINIDGLCSNGPCTVLNVVNLMTAFQSATVSNSIITGNASQRAVWTPTPTLSLGTTGVTDGGGNVYCNSRTDLATSPRCAIPNYTAATFTAGISGSTLTVGCGASCMTIEASGNSYNNTSGLVTLQVSASNAIPWGGSDGDNSGRQGEFQISGITGTGATVLNGVWYTTSGTTGTTIAFNAPPGLGSITITGGSINAAANASACQPGMFLWDNQAEYATMTPGVMIGGTAIMSGAAPSFQVFFPPGGITTTDMPTGTIMSCGWATPASAFNGQIDNTGVLTVNSNLVGSIHKGDYIADVFAALPANVRITSGSGTTWQTTYTGSGVAAEYMVSVRSDAP